MFLMTCPSRRKGLMGKQLMKLEKTEGKNERDCKWGEERESEGGKRLDTATPPSLRTREIVEFNYWMKI